MLQSNIWICKTAQLKASGPEKQIAGLAKSKLSL